jgi:hypothetical protein
MWIRWDIWVPKYPYMHSYLLNFVGNYPYTCPYSKCGLLPYPLWVFFAGTHWVWTNCQPYTSLNINFFGSYSNLKLQILDFTNIYNWIVVIELHPKDVVDSFNNKFDESGFEAIVWDYESLFSFHFTNFHVKFFIMKQNNKIIQNFIRVTTYIVNFHILTDIFICI